jgi:uncharacterized membrane protein
MHTWPKELTMSGRVDGEIVIDRPVDEVFDFVADESNEPRYNPKMRLAEKISEGPIGIGTRFRAETVSMGRAIEIVIEFTDFERPRRIVEVARVPSMDIHGILTFEPVPGGTRMRWSWSLTPRGALKLLAPVIDRMGRRQEQAIWTGLKRVLETAGGPPPPR